MAEQVTLITVVFAAVLAFALLIERAIEVLKSIYDLFDSIFNFSHFWTRRTYRIRDYMEQRLRVFEYVDAKKATAVFNRFNELLLGPDAGYQGTIPMLCGDLVRAAWVKIGCKAVATTLGIIVAFTLEFDLLAATTATDFTTLMPTTKGMLLTGITIGLGSGPVHKLIRVVEKKRAANSPQVVTNA